MLCVSSEEMEGVASPKEKSGKLVSSPKDKDAKKEAQKALIQNDKGLKLAKKEVQLSISQKDKVGKLSSSLKAKKDVLS